MIRRQEQRQNALMPRLPSQVREPAYAEHLAVALPYEMGEIISGEIPEPFLLAPPQVAVHMAVLGGSGTGKSKFLELFLRQLMIDAKGFGLWDPHGDLAKSLAAFAAAQKAHGDDVLWRKIHYLDLTPECVFSFDPAARAPLRSVVGDYAYYQWLKTRVDRMCKVILRRVAEAEQDLMVRLKRWLKCVLYACLVATDEKNSHVGLDKALVFTDPKAPEFELLYDRVKAYLPKRVRRSFEKLIDTARAIDQEKWVESTINRLEDILSPLVEAVFAQRAPSIDIKGIIDRGEFLLIDLKQNEYFSDDEKVTIGGLLLMEVLSVKEAEENVPEDQRKEFVLVVDEVGELLGDDLKRALGATRKFKCPIVLGAQDLSTFARGDFDMAAKVLTMCGTVVCFRSTYRKDKEILQDRVSCGNIDFTKRLVEVQRQRGDRYLRLDEVSENFGESRNWSKTDTATESQTHAEQIGKALALANNWNAVDSTSQGLSRKDHDDRRNDVRSNSSAHVTGKGGGQTLSNSSASTDTLGRTTSNANMEGGGLSRGVNIAHKTLILPNIVSEFEEDGSLKSGPVQQQEAELMQQIHTLDVGQAAIALLGRKEGFIAQIAPVLEWWATGDDKYEAVRRLKDRLHALHPYYFNPSAVAVAQQPPQTPAPPSGQRARPNLNKPAGKDPYA